MFLRNNSLKCVIMFPVRKHDTSFSSRTQRNSSQVLQSKIYIFFMEQTGRSNVQLSYFYFCSELKVRFVAHLYHTHNHTYPSGLI